MLGVFALHDFNLNLEVGEITVSLYKHIVVFFRRNGHSLSGRCLYASEIGLRKFKLHQHTVGEERFLVARNMVGSEGIIKSPILGGSKQCKYMEILRDSPLVWGGNIMTHVVGAYFFMNINMARCGT